MLRVECFLGWAFSPNIIVFEHINGVGPYVSAKHDYNFLKQNRFPFHHAWGGRVAPMTVEAAEMHIRSFDSTFPFDLGRYNRWDYG